MRGFSQRAAYYLAFGSAVAVLISISLSQSLLALSIVFLLLSGEKLEFPPLRLPLAAFFLTTVVALVFSGDPQGGTPQIRKFFVFGMLLAIYSTFKTIGQVKSLVVAWAVVGCVSGLLGVGQYLERRQQALAENADYYGFFLDRRITGFAGHWMTFGGEEMIVLLMLASFLLLAKREKYKLLLWPLFAILWIAVTMGMTRSIFLLGVPVGLSYLLWRRKPLLLAAMPVVAAIGLAVAPATLRERVDSVLKPHGDLDSNAHRVVCRVTGWQMVKAHPWLGLGPEQVGKQFDRYVPASVARPLPIGWYGHLHNIYLQYAAERGIPGLLAMLWFIGKAALDYLRFLRRGSLPSSARFVLHGAIAVILAILAEGFFEYNLGDSEVLTMFLAVVACGYVAGRAGKRMNWNLHGAEDADLHKADLNFARTR